MEYKISLIDRVNFLQKFDEIAEDRLYLYECMQKSVLYWSIENKYKLGKIAYSIRDVCISKHFLYEIWYTQTKWSNFINISTIDQCNIERKTFKVTFNFWHRVLSNQISIHTAEINPPYTNNRNSTFSHLCPFICGRQCSKNFGRQWSTRLTQPNECDHIYYPYILWTQSIFEMNTHGASIWERSLN